LGSLADPAAPITPGNTSDTSLFGSDEAGTKAVYEHLRSLGCEPAVPESINVPPITGGNGRSLGAQESIDRFTRLTLENPPKKDLPPGQVQSSQGGEKKSVLIA
jgi:hypothetical protein